MWGVNVEWSGVREGGGCKECCFYVIILKVESVRWWCLVLFVIAESLGFTLLRR